VSTYESHGVQLFQDWSPGAEGPYRIWVMPDPTDRYVIGADTAAGLEHGDFSDASVLSVLSGELVAKFHARLDTDLYAEELVKLGLFYNSALLGIEENNHGTAVIQAVRHIGYPNLYRQETFNEQTKRVSTRFGWRTDQRSKPLMIDDLNRAVRNQELHVYDEGTIAELKTYVRDEKGKMHGSPHDDRVISLAIANQMRRIAFMPKFADPRNDEGTFNYWMRMAHPKEAEDSYRLGGTAVRGTVSA
jgi:hypothetical protein